jgi:hypothetical protein
VRRESKDDGWGFRRTKKSIPHSTLKRAKAGYSMFFINAQLNPLSKIDHG